VKIRARAMGMAIALFLATPVARAQPARQERSVTLDPATHRLSVAGTLRLPAGAPPEFVLNARLRITESDPPVEEVPLGAWSFIGAEGVYLAGSSYWYPHVGRALVEFDITVTAPTGWHVVRRPPLPPGGSASAPSPTSPVRA
jgi:hypothetical protein